MQAGKMAIMEGAKKMMDGNKMIMEIMTKKGKMDADLTAAEKMMTEGYGMVTKGESMMTGSTMAEGQTMVKRGSKMMLDAQKKTARWIGISEAPFSSNTAASSVRTGSLKEFKAPFGNSSQSEGGLKTAQCDTERVG
jgi:hypothetical protein